MVIKERLVDACLIGDLLHAGAVDAAPDEDFVGGVEDAGFGVGGGLPGRFNHMVSRAMAVPAIKAADFRVGFCENSPCARPTRHVQRSAPTAYRRQPTTTPDGRPGIEGGCGYQEVDAVRCVRPVQRPRRTSGRFGRATNVGRGNDDPR